MDQLRLWLPYIMKAVEYSVTVQQPFTVNGLGFFFFCCEFSHGESYYGNCL